MAERLPAPLSYDMKLPTFPREVLHIAVLAIADCAQDQDEWNTLTEKEKQERIAWAWRKRVYEMGPDEPGSELIKTRPLIKDDYELAERALALLRVSSILNADESVEDGDRQEMVRRTARLNAEISVAATIPLEKGDSFDGTKFDKRVLFEMRNNRVRSQ